MDELAVFLVGVGLRRKAVAEENGFDLCDGDGHWFLFL
jgi:hypothetical protein